MARYQDIRNMVSHNINSLTIMLSNADNKVKWSGLERFEAELDEDENTTDAVADGTAIHVENPRRTGTIKITCLEASAVTDEVMDILDSNAQFQITAKDSNADNFDVTGNYCLVRKRPPVVRGKEPDKPEWVFSVTYLSIRGGSYALATV